MTESLGQTIVVDAANVVGSRPDGWWRDRVGAARGLLAGLAAFAAQVPESSVVVVLEGAAKAAADQPVATGLRVVTAPGSGDDAIVAAVAAAVADGPVTVVTADRGLRARVEALGAHPLGPRRLLDLIDSATRPR